MADLFKKARSRIFALSSVALVAILGAIGALYQHEFVSILEKGTLSGTLELEVAHPSVLEKGEVVVLETDHHREAAFQLRDKTKVNLRPGSYVVQVFYPSLSGGRGLIMETPFDAHRWETTKVRVDYAPPNLITLKMDFPKYRYLREEQLAFSVRSNGDGYLWLFSPEGSMPNLFFPNSASLDNHIEAGKRYNIPALGTFTLKTSATAGEDTIIGIITETDHQGHAFGCLKKVVPEVKVKVSIAHEERWGYARAVLKVE
jgi:hypothetical protein